MAITVSTSQPSALLNNIKKQIEEKKIRTWAFDKDGDFTHTPEQWANKAWLRPKILNGKLLLTIIPPQNTKLSSEVYAVYHGRFIEMLLEHVDQHFQSASASAMPEQGDIV
jgi:hypothetical protein